MQEVPQAAGEIEQASGVMSAPSFLKRPCLDVMSSVSVAAATCLFLSQYYTPYPFPPLTQRKIPFGRSKITAFPVSVVNMERADLQAL